MDSHSCFCRAIKEVTGSDHLPVVAAVVVVVVVSQLDSKYPTRKMMLWLSH